MCCTSACAVASFYTLPGHKIQNVSQHSLNVVFTLPDEDICDCCAAGQHPDPFKHIADEFCQINSSKTHAKLVDTTQLPRRQAHVRKVDDAFWRQSTSAYAQPAGGKKRRKQTLSKAPRKAARVAKPGRQLVSAALLNTTDKESWTRCVGTVVNALWIVEMPVLVNPATPDGAACLCCAAGYNQ